MAIYAIGDIQGCYDELRQLLDLIRFEPAHDQLWFAGDLVNRGPKSLQSLRFVRSLGDSAITVLGNHDLHLLACAEGIKQDTDPGVHEILQSDDREELLYWLRNRPLLHHDPELGFTLLHAGLPPQWDLALALACAEELHAVLHSDDYHDLLHHMYGNQPNIWSDDLRGWQRLRFISNAFTRLRYCDRDGRLALKAKGPPGTQPSGYMPWFEVPGRKSRDMKILFGHWSTLGVVHTENAYSLDTGCVWGGKLTALKIGHAAHDYYQVQCPGACAPKLA